MRISMLAAVAGAVLAASPAVAQDDEITVTGREQRAKQIDTFVRALTNVPGRDPLARFDYTTLCPGVTGLAEARNAEITSRMRVVAKAAGINLARAADCKPNALVIITPEPELMIEALRKAHPIYFKDAAGRFIDPPKQTGPAIAWHLEGRIDRNGSPVPFNPDTGQFEYNTTLTPSRISATMRPVFLAAVVVIDVDALVGLTPVQVADYAAMRLYTRSDPAKLKASDAPTILTILDAADDAEVPVTLTQWDLAYLKSLYGTAPFRSAATQKGEIKQELGKDLDKAAAKN
jgi:hypothetical protein